MAYHDLRNITLVGHSYGGLIVTGVASRMPDRISHLVYLDAFVPTHAGQSASRWHRAEQRAMMQAWLAQNTGHVPPRRIETWGQGAETQDWLAKRCTPHPRPCIETGLDVVSDPSELDLARHYILCAGNAPSAFWQFYEMYMPDPRWQTSQLPCLHDAMIEAPSALSEYLLALA